MICYINDNITSKSLVKKSTLHTLNTERKQKERELQLSYRKNWWRKQQRKEGMWEKETNVDFIKFRGTNNYCIRYLMYVERKIK